jgi:hypothetical protein
MISCGSYDTFMYVCVGGVCKIFTQKPRVLIPKATPRPATNVVPDGASTMAKKRHVLTGARTMSSTPSSSTSRG